MEIAAEQRDGGGEIPLKRRLTLPELYDQHFRTMVKLASIYVDDTGTAEEVVQDAFVKLISGDYKIEGARQVAYLRQMVLNGARSKLRKRRVRRDHIPDDPGTAPAAELAGVASAEREQVVAAIRKLPKNQANVILLRYYLDLSEGEIAETLGIARGSVKSHAHRGLKRLRVVLGDRQAIDLTESASASNDRSGLVDTGRADIVNNVNDANDDAVVLIGIDIEDSATATDKSDESSDVREVS